MIALIALDIDGTLIGSKGHVEDCVWRALEKVQQSGIKLIVSTGRPCFGIAQKVAERLDDTLPHIFQNGAHIADSSGQAQHVFALKEEITKPLVELARSQGLTLELYTPSTLYIERKTPMSEAHAKMIGVNAIVQDLHEVIEREPIIRAQWIIPSKRLEQVLTNKLAGVSIGVATAPAQADTFFVSVTQANISKGSALKLVCEGLKINLNQVMAVGDSEGDTPMLDLAGQAVVMANASTALKNRYPHHAGNVESCGIVELLEQVIESES